VGSIPTRFRQLEEKPRVKAGFLLSQSQLIVIKKLANNAIFRHSTGTRNLAQAMGHCK